MMLFLPFILYLYLLAPCYWAFICQNTGPPSEFRMDWDYTIAGFFRLRSYSTTEKPRPEVDICDRAASVDSHGYHLLQAMRFAIEKINNSSSLLLNVTLGYEIYNTCSVSANMYATLSILAQSRQHHVEVLSNFTHYQPKAVALIGPDSSQFILITAAILSILLMPEISYEASNEVLSLKHAYPSFLHTIPSDRLQVEAVVLLLKEFRWNWIAMVDSDDAFGRNGIKTLQAVVAKNDICAAYQGIIPTKGGASSPELKEMVRVLTRTGVKVTVVFSNVDSAKDFSDMVVQENVTEKVYIPGIHRIGTVIGLSVKQAKLPGLEEFESTHVNSEKSNIATTPDIWTSFNVYSAVFAVAHGMHHLLGCCSGACSKDKVHPWQLLEKIKQVNFTLQKSQVHFDGSGDPLTGYDLVIWKWTGQTWSFDVIGSFRQNPNRLNIGQAGLLWHTKDNQVPVSTCSKVCVKGEKRLQVGLHECCFDCVACPTRTFLNSSGQHNGPNLFIGACTAAQVVMCLVLLSTNPSVPRKDYTTFMMLIIFQCSEDDAIGGLLYNTLLGICCFVISYMGKDLSENYNETKCITCSLLINFVCFIGFLTTYVFYQGKYLVAIIVLSNLTTLSGIFGGYFLLKGYIILFRAEVNTTEHFQMSIQSYTTKRSLD
uniref:Taste 1 receptor member 1 n=1 Tax=Gopherus evgoodei TaxID=1825980 RepID=A0A8C4YNT0_9SAUR